MAAGARVHSELEEKKERAREEGGVRRGERRRRQGPSYPLQATSVAVSISSSDRRTGHSHAAACRSNEEDKGCFAKNPSVLEFFLES
jgi:hypothetical protein